MIRQGHYQTLVPYGYNADIVVNIVKENGRSTGNRWRLTVDDSVVSLKHSSYWSSKADAVAKAYRLAQDGLLEDAIKKLDKAFPEFKNGKRKPNGEVSTSDLFLYIFLKNLDFWLCGRMIYIASQWKRVSMAQAVSRSTSYVIHFYLSTRD